MSDPSFLGIPPDLMSEIVEHLKDTHGTPNMGSIIVMVMVLLLATTMVIMPAN